MDADDETALVILDWAASSGQEELQWLVEDVLERRHGPPPKPLKPHHKLCEWNPQEDKPRIQNGIHLEGCQEIATVTVGSGVVSRSLAGRWYFTLCDRCAKSGLLKRWWKRTPIR